MSTRSSSSSTTICDATTKSATDVDVEDPYIWLEDVESKESLDFAKASNEKCLKALGDPTEGPTYDRVLKVLESEDRIAYASCHGRDPEQNDQRIYYNFWRDKDHPKGIWRKTTEDEYNSSDKPAWTTVLDVDALAEKDGISWVYKGSSLLPRSKDPTNGKIVTRALLQLSRGGSDAVHVKEFDLPTAEFVGEEDGGFCVGEAKTRITYKGRDVLLIGSDFGEGSLTDSGYPRTVKEWSRGTPLEDAPTVFEGEATDVAVNGYVADQRNWGGNLWQVHSRSITFYTGKYWFAKLTEDHLLKPEDRPEGLPEPEFREMEIQDDAGLDYMGNILFIELRSDWTPKDDADGTGIGTGVTYKQGSVIYCDFEKFWSGGKNSVDYSILFEPTAKTAYNGFGVTKNYLILSTTDTVKSKLEFYKLGDNGNSITKVSTGDTEAKIRDASFRSIDTKENDEFWFTTSGYTTPSTMYSADLSKIEEEGASGKEDAFVKEKLKSLPSQYNSDDLVVEQKFATSKDGTEVPYFMIRKKDIELNGKNPTLLYGYGGFEISLTPRYGATTGLAWLERGGVYVEANIRGGGEFGPGWHQAALKENRNKAYEDFIAVGEHLIESGICKPKTLAARGGSNGGLLMGNMYVMRPDLWGAIHCAVPLLDMKRFHTLLAGASWMAEYGNPDKDWDDFLYQYSPYHNIDADQASYPPLLVTTSTRDDRVHPGHARKFVKKLWDKGEGKDWPVYYYENIEGGHGGAADAKQSAFMTALAFDFMFKTLSENAKNMD
eukprot:jgi/Psemu1/30400/gm1.30400_g